MDTKNNQILNEIENIKKSNIGINIRRLYVLEKEIYILYISQLTDRLMLINSIIKPILSLNSKPDIESLLNSIIQIDDAFIEDKDDKILEHILSGKSVIISPLEDKYIVANTIKIEKRAIGTPEIEFTNRGPRDSFTESFDTNISLIRFRIKDKNFRIENLTLGKRTKTNIALLYIEDIANKKYLDIVKNKINSIDLDRIIESGDLQKIISNNSFNLFPQVGSTERPDVACAGLLEGRIILVVEGSNFVLVLPKTFEEFFDSPDDHYTKNYYSIFVKALRMICLYFTLTLSASYVALVGFHSDILPTSYIIALASTRATVPFNALIEAFSLELVVEILREGSMRLPKQVGSAVGIVGTIVIGQAAVSAGLVSPLLVIIVAFSMLCSFIAPDFSIMIPFRVLKFLMIIFSGLLGLYGFIIGLTIIITNIISLDSFTVPYLSPVAPFNFNDFKNYILSDILTSRKRPEALKNKDKIRRK